MPWVCPPYTPPIALGVPLPTGDQLVCSMDTSPFREGSWSLAASGALFTLVGDFVMKYWSHNTALDASGNFVARDDAGPCALITFSEGIGTNAPIYAMWSCPTGIAGSAPGTFTKVYSIDLTTGAITFASTDTSGTPGAATINKTRGRVAIAAAASSVVVTNSLVTAASTVLVSLGGADATATSVRVTPGAGSFTITANAAATAATPCDFFVVS